MVALEAFETKWPELSIIGRMWRENWQHIIPFLAFEPEVRRVIYTTNAIEALNRQLRKAIKTMGSFPSEEAAIKLVHLAICNAVPQWTRTRGVDESDARVQDPVRRPHPQLTIKPAYTDFRTPSLARDLGISDVTLRNWVKEERTARGERPGGLSGDEREELRRLRDENATLRMEREILRKAAVFFAREDDGRSPRRTR